MLKAVWLNGYQDLSDAYYIRRKVFIEEQGVPEEDEMDNKDSLAMHLVLYDDEKPAGTARVVIDKDKFVIGRIAVLKEKRGQKYGDFIVRLAIRKIFTSGGKTQYIYAQTAAVPFYEKLGFEKFGEEYMDCGIPHFPMKRSGDIECCGL